MHVEKPEGLLLEKHLVIVEPFSEVTPIGKAARNQRGHVMLHMNVQSNVARHPLERLPLRKDCQIIP
jgi:excinuclease UvrABC helicase subunit UvrB